MNLINLIYYVTIVAMTIIWEAPHQPALGQELVAHTIVNRAEMWDMSIEAVVMAEGQYAGWTPHRRERWLRCAIEAEVGVCMDPVAEIDMIRVPGGYRPATQADWAAIWWIAFQVVTGKPEPAGFEGVTHFDNPGFWAAGEPPWAPSKENLGRVGDHVFYR